MAGRSELEEYLFHQQAEGTLDGVGTFTLSREKALEKLAAFQLPRETAWILKVVQAAVLSGASFLQIKQTGSDTEICFDPQEEWTLETIESALCDPETTPMVGLDHLKRGLWSVSINGMRPFQCALHQSQDSLVWTGNDFRRPACKPSDYFGLTVSHRTIYQGKGLPVLRSIEAAHANSALAQELTSGAFVCPIPLSLDGRRIDALQACPSHGLTAGSYPACLLLARGTPPYLPAPQASFGKFVSKETTHGGLNKLLQSVDKPPDSCAAMLISLHVRQVTENKSTVWKHEPQTHIFYWVRHGVVVDRQPITELEESSVSCAVFASADDLRSDLTGFRVARDSDTLARQKQIYAALADKVEAAELSLKSLVDRSRREKRIWGGFLIVGGGLFAFVSPIHGFGAAGIGLYSLLTAGNMERELEADLQAKLRQLQSQWRQLILATKMR